MQIALATNQPLSWLLRAQDKEIATWMELLEEQAEAAERRRH